MIGEVCRGSPNCGPDGSKSQRTSPSPTARTVIGLFDALFDEPLLGIYSGYRLIRSGVDTQLCVPLAPSSARVGGKKLE
jgi:hypothetical protein